MIDMLLDIAPFQMAATYTYLPIVGTYLYLPTEGTYTYVPTVGTYHRPKNISVALNVASQSYKVPTLWYILN